MPNSDPDPLAGFTPETAWVPYFPTSSKPWDATRVGHLYRRAAFGPTSSDIDSGLDRLPSEIVEELLTGGDGQAEFEDQVARLTESVLDSGSEEQLQSLWMYRLINSPHPLEERMTLFWHDHFATSLAKVRSERLMHRQIALCREHALGRFDELLADMAVDPAMLLWLDSNKNVKGKPNENLAREILELFSLGVGNYTETDIQEAARALTGWDVQDGEAVFDPKKFDEGEKTILGQTGPWAAGDVVRIALAQPACSRFLVRKVFAEFVSETVEPPDELLEPLADEFRIRNYDIAWLVRTILNSFLFYSDAAIRQKVKSPVEFVVGMVRSLQGRVSPAALADTCGKLGQALYFPPSVKGWDGGSDWLNSTTLLARQNLAFEIATAQPLGTRCDPARIAREQHLHQPEELASFFLTLFHQDDDPDVVGDIAPFLAELSESLEKQFYSDRSRQARLAREAAHLALTLPEYQLG